MTKRDEIGDEIKTLAAQAGASVEISRGKKHPRAIISKGDKRRIYSYPGTSGDRRAHQNTISAIKRLLREI